MEIGVVSGSVCWRKMSWGKRKCAREAPGKENEAWKGCGRWFRSGIIEMWTWGSCKHGVSPSPLCKHCLINSLPWNSWIWSTAERNSPAVGWPALPLLCLRPGSVGRDFGTLLLSDPSWDCWKPQGQVCMVPSNVCQNGFVVGWGVSASHCWDPPWTSALGGYFGMIWVSCRLLELRVS